MNDLLLLLFIIIIIIIFIQNIKDRNPLNFQHHK